VLIRFERSSAVIAGTVVRFGAGLTVLMGGFVLAKESVSGVALGASAIAAGVIAEAVYASWQVRPVLRDRLRDAPPLPEPLTRGKFLTFYLPLALTPLMTLIIQPLGAASMNRMPEALSSLAAWGPVYGLVFLTRTAGFAFNEVTVTLLGSPGGHRQLRRFVWLLVLVTTMLLCGIAFTPLGGLWFHQVGGLAPELTAVAVSAVTFAVLMPGYAVLQNWYQGALVHSHSTRGITEAVLLYLVVSSVGLGIGIQMGSIRGIEFAICTFTVAGLIQTLWLRVRAGPALRELSE
jgi:hypothetical protein